MTIDSREFRLETRPHNELCSCGRLLHHHAPITPEHAAWCRFLATRVIGPHRTLLADGHVKCVVAFPGMTIVRGAR